MHETLLFEANNGIGWLVLNRPDRLNATTNRMAVELHNGLEAIA